MKTVKVLLAENVENLGIVGDVVSVRSGYARNYLLPRSLGIAPTQANVGRLAERRKKVEEELRVHREQLAQVFEKIKDHELTIMRSANEQGILFGGVSQHDIAQALRAEGFTIEDRAVRIGEQIKRLDSYQIPLVLAADMKTEIKLWVVSDKPMDQQQQQRGEPQAAADAGAGNQGEEKPKKKSRKAREEEAAAAAEGEAKAEKPAKGEKAEKGEKSEKGEKAEKGEKSEKPEKGEKSKGEKAEKAGKSEDKGEEKAAKKGKKDKAAKAE